jgi:GNAT superfamily N-acetyltransferase
LQAGKRNYPQYGIETRDLAGGLLAYSGVSGAMSEAVAIGIDCDVSARVVDEITEFFRAHDAAPRANVSPLCNLELAPLLARSGYVPTEYQNMLVADLDILEGEHDPRITEVADVAQWADASARGFSDDADPGDVLHKVSLVIATGGATALEVRDGSEVVATAAYAFENDGVALFAASTLPAHRRQGWQRAMIRERIARAKDAGMRFVRVCAAPLGDSERNFRALGFVPLYTRVTWELRAPA